MDEYSASCGGNNGGPRLARKQANLLALNHSVTIRPEMAQFRTRTAPATTAELERLFGVEGMSAGRKVSHRWWHGVLAHDLPVGEQLMIGMQYVAMGAAPPLLVGLLLAAWVWATTPAHLW